MTTDVSGVGEISLRRMNEDEFKTYLDEAIPAYASEKKKGEGLTDEQAMKVAVDSYNQLLPQGLASPNHFFFKIIEKNEAHGEVPIGSLWFARKIEPRLYAWIYDIAIDEKVRGRGYGRRAMELVEFEVRRLGIKSVGLHVFGHNKIAQDLYEKIGFRTTNRIMAKELKD